MTMGLTARMRTAWLGLAAAFVFGGCADDPDRHVQLSRSFTQPGQTATAFGDVRDPAADAADPSPDIQGGDTAGPADLVGPDDVEPGPDGDVGPAVDSGPTDTTAPPDDTTVPDLEGPPPYPADRVLSPITPHVVERLKTVAARDPTLQDDVFMKVGASTSVSSNFLKCFATNGVDFGAFTALVSTRDFFLDGDAGGGDPFSRASLSAKSGVSAGWALDGDPPPLLIEYGAIAPRFALVHYGTNDMGLGSTYLNALFPFSDNLLEIVDTLLDLGVIPILATIQRRLDRPAADLWVSTYNNVIRAIAKGREVPLVDMWLANEDLPRHGLAADGLHSASSPEGACVFTPAGLQYGMNHRNLQMLTMLSRLEAALLDDEAADPASPISVGIGTSDDPIVIDTLPYQDLRDTRQGPSDAFDRYTGCAPGTNESGPEFVYALTLAEETRLRITVHDRDTTDIDLHLLDETGTPEGCLLRNDRALEATLGAGVWYLVLDTFVSSSGAERAGEYVLSVIACPPEDPGCGQ